ncbi:MAG: LON peptidase substrate-binding domain-containing protein [Candidatus Binataceae bacterium]|nr:LON peptidase substrate-binding domain-containing protein [Candidatus Binataceae bacterium]
MPDLPKIIPLFPLPNLVMFPGLRVPLHIFEPRYRQMIADIEQTDGVIGMVLLKEDWEEDYETRPDIFEIGCAGKIEEIEKLPDGRFNLILEGTAEFRVVRELRDRMYRRADVEWTPVSAPALVTDPEMMETLRELLFNYLGTEPAEQAWNTLVEERGLTGASLVNFLCFHLDVAPIEKQTLLESRAERIGCLIDILTFKIEERKLGPNGPGGRVMQ